MLLILHGPPTPKLHRQVHAKKDHVRAEKASRLLTPPVLPSNECWFPCSFGLSLDGAPCISDERPSPSINKSSFHRTFRQGQLFSLFSFYFRSTLSVFTSLRLFLRSLDSIGNPAKAVRWLRSFHVSQPSTASFSIYSGSRPLQQLISRPKLAPRSINRQLVSYQYNTYNVHHIPKT